MNILAGFIGFYAAWATKPLARRLLLRYMDWHTERNRVKFEHAYRSGIIDTTYHLADGRTHLGYTDPSAGGSRIGALADAANSDITIPMLNGDYVLTHYRGRR